MSRLAEARAIAGAVLDPELVVVTVADLGILSDVRCDGDRVTVTITPTFVGCPAIAEIATDVRSSLEAAGFSPVQVRTVLDPPWTTDRITPEGRRKLRAGGIAPPSPATVHCPSCTSTDTAEQSRFGPAPCLALRRCASCGEPFEHVRPYT